MPGRRAGEAGEHLRVNDAEPGRRQHRDRQFRCHRHVERDPVACLQAQVFQHGRELVDPDVQLAVGDRLVRLALRLGYKDQGGLVRLVREVTVDAVVAGVQLAADEPLPERRVRRVEHRVPLLGPSEQVRVSGEALRELVLGELLANRRVRRVSLRRELGRRGVKALLAPVDRDERLGRFGSLVSNVV